MQGGKDLLGCQELISNQKVVVISGPALDLTSLGGKKTGDSTKTHTPRASRKDTPQRFFGEGWNDSDKGIKEKRDESFIHNGL